MPQPTLPVRITIPFAAADPLRVIPSMMAGGAVTGATNCGATAAGRKSATAAHMMMMSAEAAPTPAAGSTAVAISPALSTSMRRTRGGVGKCTGPATSVTSAPRRAASAASAKPIFPDERLPRKRTGSSASKVGPAVTSTRCPARSGRPLASSSAAAASEITDVARLIGRIADGTVSSHRRTSAGDAHEAGRRPRTVGLGLPGLGAPAPSPQPAGCAR